MERFYAPDLLSTSETIELSPDESHHIIRVFRKHAGETVTIANGDGLMATATITGQTRKTVQCSIQSIEQISRPEPQLQIAISCIRPNRMDWAIEKLTELGVATIQPLICEHTSVRHFKIDHSRKIAVSAMKQSGIAWLPELREPMSFSDWVAAEELQENTVRMLAHLDPSSQPVGQFCQHSTQKISVAIGPEGGFSAKEIAIADAANFRFAKLDNAILRAETAAIVAATQIKSLFLK
ncbi:MAG: 16S rRNA (uracil(1498)-N(3))-methyltransferase [Calditrichae bacterium]|nr:16S rRNA (uracil(1498)-N(3))-methyltransferase [Calditrichia bacterium]